MAKRLYNDGEERKPAVTVKCKYCNWTGSSRGLFTHVRLGHPGISKKPESTQRHEYHPLSVENRVNEKLIVFKEKYGKRKETTEEIIIRMVATAINQALENQYKTLERGNKPYLISPKNL
jgi:pantothenate kinase type III